MKLASLALTASLLMVPSANAAVVSFEYTASQDFSIVGDLTSVAGIASTLSTISGVISFDTSTADTNADSMAGQYMTGSITVNEIALPVYTFTMSIFDGDTSEQFSLSGQDGPESVLLSLQAIGADAFASDALPGGLVLGDFNALNELQFFSGNDFSQFTVSTLTPTDMPQVPVPAALPLFLSGLAGLRLLRRRR
ncbi:MAG: hypothetical protein AB8G18_07390 [Gammaproteobacteria bacterium]